MIKYNLRADGKAINFGYQRDGTPLPEGFKSIPGDKIPEDISQYNTQEYIDYLDKQKINQEVKAFINDTNEQVITHRDQVDNGDSLSLTNTKYKALLTQRQEARNKIIE